MTTRTLTIPQATEMALALMGIEPNLKAYDPKDFDQHVEITKIEPTVGATQLGIMIEFDFTSNSRWSQLNSPAVKYQLYIGYYETVGQFNPAIISLSRDVNDKPNRGEQMFEVEVLGNLALVTDRLRQFKVW